MPSAVTTSMRAAGDLLASRGVPEGASARRLTTASGLVLTAAALFLVSHRLVTGVAPGAHEVIWLGALGAATAAVAAASGRIAPNRLPDLALVFQVLAAVCIGFLFNRSHADDPVFHPHLSPVAALILVFPLLVPHRPGPVLAAGVLSTAADTVSLAVWSGGWPALFLGRALSDLVAVGFSLAGLRTLHLLHARVRQARRLGSYQLVRLLGRGGMGQVWEARHRMLARPAAVKVISPALEAASRIPEERDRILARFEREARASAVLRSPNTIVTYDYGATEEGEFYLAMELLDGLDLDSLVRRFGPVSSGRAVHLLRQIARSLREAHRLGIVHRDVKPANVFTCRYGDEVDFVKVLDFGLARSLDLGDPGITAENMLVGTPAFMAPEMATGGTVDARADLYALGGTAYWLLTGRLVFEAETPLSMVLRHIHDAPAPPSLRSEMEIPEALEDLVMRLLEKDPTKRPASAEEVLRLLDTARDDGTWSEIRRREWWDRHLPGSQEPRPDIAPRAWLVPDRRETGPGPVPPRFTP